MNNDEQMKKKNMEKQKIFLLVIAAGAIFILIQQGSQSNSNRLTSFNQHSGDDQQLKHDIIHGTVCFCVLFIIFNFLT